MDFFHCEHCGNIITFLTDAGNPVTCCGEKMKKLKPGTVDASVEKHVPVVKTEGNQVTVFVGKEEHPMMPEHHIEWIVLETACGIQKKDLCPGEKPIAVFCVSPEDKVVAIYEYCNLHGLWKA